MLGNRVDEPEHSTRNARLHHRLDSKESGRGPPGPMWSLTRRAARILIAVVGCSHAARKSHVVGLPEHQRLSQESVRLPRKGVRELRWPKYWLQTTNPPRYV
ncbi:MAG: hypothetical protein ACI835_001607 [Planctomycetota bacterium]|jgi:hypothetical protein